MLLRLTPDQVSDNWPLIKIVIDELLGEDEVRDMKILQLMISEIMHVFSSYEKNSGRFEAIIITSFAFDEIISQKSLIIYGLRAFNRVSKNSWEEGFTGVQNFAKGMGCQKIVAYTKDPMVVNLGKKFGFYSESFLVKEIS